MATAMDAGVESGGGTGAQPPLTEVDGGLARVTRQLLMAGDDPAARLRALMPLELGIFGLGDLAQPVLVRDFLNTLTLASGHAYPAAVLSHHAYYLLRAASFSRRSYGLGHLEAALDVLASSLPVEGDNSSAPADPLDGSRLVRETRALAAEYRRILEDGRGEVLSFSGPASTFAFAEELVADTYLARWDAFPREGLSFYAFNEAKTTLGRWLVTVYAETNRYPWAAATGGARQPTAADIKAMAVELVERGAGGGGEGGEDSVPPSSAPSGQASASAHPASAHPGRDGLFHRPESLASVVASLPLARRRAVEILGVYAEASGGQSPPAAAVPVLAFDAAWLRLLHPSGALFYDYVYEALLWDQTYGTPDSVIEAFLAGVAAELEGLAARVQEAAGGRASFSPAAIERVAMVLLSAGLNEAVAGDYAVMLASVPRASRARWRGLEPTAALLESLSGFALHFFRLMPTASPTSRFARAARATYLRAEAEAADRRRSPAAAAAWDAVTPLRIFIVPPPEAEYEQVARVLSSELLRSLLWVRYGRLWQAPAPTPIPPAPIPSGGLPPTPGTGAAAAASAVAPQADVEAYCRSLKAGQTVQADPAYVRSPFFPAAFIEFQIWPSLRRVLSNELPKARSLAALRWLVSFGSDQSLPSATLTRARRPLELIYATVWEIYDGAPPMPGEPPDQRGGRTEEGAGGKGAGGGGRGDEEEEEEGAGPWGVSSHDAVLRIMDAVREVSGIISETLSTVEERREEAVAPPIVWPTSLFSLLFTLRYSTTAEGLSLATRRFLVAGETLSEDVSRLTGAAQRLCSRPILYDTETGQVQIPLVKEEDEEEGTGGRYYSTDLQTLKSVVEGVQDVCRDAAARWALTTADTAALRRRHLVPALRESRGIADHPLWENAREPLRPDLEELNERVERALDLGYALTGALRASVAYRLRDHTFARLFQPPAMDAERAEALVRRDLRPPPIFTPAPPRLPERPGDVPPLGADDILYLGKSVCRALTEPRDPAAPETTPIKTYTPAVDLNPEQITVTPISPSVLAAFTRAARSRSQTAPPALTDEAPAPPGQTPPPFRILSAERLAVILLANGRNASKRRASQDLTPPRGHRASSDSESEPGEEEARWQDDELRDVKEEDEEEGEKEGRPAEIGTPPPKAEAEAEPQGHRRRRRHRGGNRRTPPGRAASGLDGGEEETEAAVSPTRPTYLSAAAAASRVRPRARRGASRRPPRPTEGHEQ
ncbi:BOLF1 [macacine gammaherpesvirus 10]|uniref:BOLF1 n=1 Tax=macacine gammaherpesvirus 10 TaxID=2560569 RepID=A0A0S0BVL5_9GAMA|nr:BOLF1 [macacine gammaherpesvirus 10]ALF03219.1 BOLF1 [macacine gammaherpesvirus 10]